MLHLIKPTQTPELQLPHLWAPRPYQLAAWKALVHDHKKRAVLLWHRRAGKDLLLLNATIVASQRRRGVYWHVFPTAKQGRKILWEGVTKDGRAFLDHWPRALVAARGEADMRLKLHNGSIWQIVGADNFNEALIGGNPAGLVFSEYALQNPAAWDHLRPILAENDGWAAFAFTPRGLNHGQKLYAMASANPSWFAERLTIVETGAIDAEAIEEERRAGMSEELIAQEFYCSFTAALTGAYYGKLLEDADREGRMTKLTPTPGQRVETWWDLGMNDATAIWFVARAGEELHVLDYYEASGEALSHYADVLHAKGYAYERHVLPHDVSVRELGTGRSRLETLRDLGIGGAGARAQIAPKLRVADGINAVRTILPRCRFDADKCEQGLNALKQYQRHWNETRRTYEDHPHHDWTSHAADAFRYGALLQRLLPRRPVPPVGWRERDIRANGLWPPLEWGEPEFPRTREERDYDPLI
jgi:hypothetical protein